MANCHECGDLRMDLGYCHVSETQTAFNWAHERISECESRIKVHKHPHVESLYAARLALTWVANHSTDEHAKWLAKDALAVGKEQETA